MYEMKNKHRTLPVCHWSDKQIVPPQTHAIGWENNMRWVDRLLKQQKYFDSATVFTHVMQEKSRNQPTIDLHVSAY